MAFRVRTVLGDDVLDDRVCEDYVDLISHIKDVFSWETVSIHRKGRLSFQVDYI